MLNLTVWFAETGLLGRGEAMWKITGPLLVSSLCGSSFFWGLLYCFTYTVPLGHQASGYIQLREAPEEGCAEEVQGVPLPSEAFHSALGSHFTAVWCSQATGLPLFSRPLPGHPLLSLRIPQTHRKSCCSEFGLDTKR